MTSTGMLERIEDIGLLMVLRARSADDALTAVAAAHDGGVRSVEVTFTTPEAPAVIERVRAAYDDLLVGAGTVLTIAQAEAALVAGASYLVSPGFDRGLLGWAADQDVLAVPGVLTPTEVTAAVSADARAVKLFPASTVGTGHLRALLGPFPDLRIIPTGGVSASNAVDWLDAGAVAVGIGGALSPNVTVTPDVAATITSAATESVAAVRTRRTDRNQEMR